MNWFKQHKPQIILATIIFIGFGLSLGDFINMTSPIVEVINITNSFPTGATICINGC